MGRIASWTMRRFSVNRGKCYTIKTRNVWRSIKLGLGNVYIAHNLQQLNDDSELHGYRQMNEKNEWAHIHNTVHETGYIHAI